jgi:hypothetical protein
MRQKKEAAYTLNADYLNHSCDKGVREELCHITELQLP